MTNKTYTICTECGASDSQKTVGIDEYKQIKKEHGLYGWDDPDSKEVEGEASTHYWVRESGEDYVGEWKIYEANAGNIHIINDPEQYGFEVVPVPKTPDIDLAFDDEEVELAKVNVKV